MRRFSVYLLTFLTVVAWTTPSHELVAQQKTSDDPAIPRGGNSSVYSLDILTFDMDRDGIVTVTEFARVVSLAARELDLAHSWQHGPGGSIHVVFPGDGIEERYVAPRHCSPPPPPADAEVVLLTGYEGGALSTLYKILGFRQVISS